MCNREGTGNGKWTIIKEGEIREESETRLNDEIPVIPPKKSPAKFKL